MKRKSLLVALVSLVAVMSTGCVKIIDKGTEAQYTGVVEFSAESNANSLWESVVEDITTNAVDLATLLSEANGDLNSVAEKYGVKQKANFAVKGSGTVTEVETSKSAGYMTLKLDGYDGPVEIRVQVGPTFKNKDSLGDAQTVTSFEDYTNQTEWGQVKDALIDNVKTNVVGNVDVDSLNGQTITFIGAFSASAGNEKIQIIPISIE
ncbi:MAG: DUF2291 family protein [Lachnospiraceae bacterium]|nr:DUF2291 family protein [Lachnospiraceae bacterium]